MSVSEMPVDVTIFIMSVIGSLGIIRIFEFAVDFFVDGVNFGYVVFCFFRDYKAARDSDYKRYNFFVYLKMWIKQYFSVMNVKARDCKTCEFLACPYIESVVPAYRKPDKEPIKLFYDGKNSFLKSLFVCFEYSFLFGGIGFISLFIAIPYHGISFDSLFNPALAVFFKIFIFFFFISSLVDVILYLIEKYHVKSKIDKS